ncbi:MAG: MBL fold metallo-hydrolase [Gemmatimonadaceae bacterium]|nr:MBL fold metallo-hydrolase [Gemmatimonadaceae bacterium]MCW5826232.1 MBL fold metallo-hydrolase [Gemmatimonadaceae bacterium]
MKLTFLGTGTSFGVPQIGCACAVCRSEDPRDKRTRVGAVVEDAGLRLLIDTPPELRLQLIAAGIDRLDAVLFTHEHADHTHGIDDIRAISVRRDGALPMYGPKETLDGLTRRFSYIFDAAMKPLPGTSKPEGFAQALAPGVPTRIGHLDVTAVALPHGRVRVFGYRIGPLAYVTDAKELTDEAVVALRGAEVLVLNALFRTSHPTHFSIGEAVDAARRVGARRCYFTHLTHETSHAALAAALPDDIQPAYDGLSVEFGS